MQQAGASASSPLARASLARQDTGMRVASMCTSAVLAAIAVLASAAPAAAAGFSARLYAGPGYMATDSADDRGDSSGAALLTQLDAGLQLSPLLVLHGTLLYDYSSWMAIDGLVHEHPGSMLGFGVGATLAFAGFRVGASAGGQFTSFTSADDPSSGPNGAGLGSFIAAHAGYVVPIALGTSAGLHALARYRSSPDETSSVVYDPRGYQLGLALSIGLDGEP